MFQNFPWQTRETLFFDLLILHGIREFFDRFLARGVDIPAVVGYYFGNFVIFRVHGKQKVAQIFVKITKRFN